MQQNFILSKDPLSLDHIRAVLIRLEDTIIFSLIERAQFAHNRKIYEAGAFAELRELGFQGSWLEWFLKEIETFHAKARRYTSPDEYPFTSDLPGPIIPPISFPPILHPNPINVNPFILSFYTRNIVPRITRQASHAITVGKQKNGYTNGNGHCEDDGNYGSAATIDVEVLQAISKRVHYGKFVSESKFRDHPSHFIPHILNPNRAALEALITKPEVERKLLQRLRNKAAVYGQELGPGGEPLPEPEKGEWKIELDGVTELYEKYIIPLTKDVEVDYLLSRLDGLSQDEIAELAKR